MLNGELEFYKQGYHLIVGLDEAGRGPLAGPLFVGAVIFKEGYSNGLINDSKQLTPKQRETLFEVIKRDALYYHIEKLEADEVDKLDPYHASQEGMKRCLEALKGKYDFAITDAMPLGTKYPHQAFVKGDAKFISVAAASILAKVARDHFMDELDSKYPQYDFKSNKGYGTKKHLEALEKYGPIKGVHRYSYKPVQKVLNQQIFLF